MNSVVGGVLAVDGSRVGGVGSEAAWPVKVCVIHLIVVQR